MELATGVLRVVLVGESAAGESEELAEHSVFELLEFVGATRRVLG